MRFICALLLLLVASPAGAEVDAAAVANPYKGKKVAALQITGLEDPLRSELRSGLALAQRRGLLRRKSTLYPRVLAEDVARTKLWLARNGFPTAEINPRVDPRGDEVEVTLAIEPGPPSLLLNVSVEGWPADVAAPVTPRRLRAGERFADDPALAWAVLLRARLRKAGYAYASVQPRVTLHDNRVTLVLAAKPLGRFEVGDILVRGCGEDLVPLVRKTLEVESGDVFSPAELEDAELRVRQLDLFRQIKLSFARADSNRLDVLADLLERDPRTIEAGGGYWTDELFRVHAMWRHRNLLGGGRGAQVSGSWSAYLREARAALWWPALLGSRTRVQLSGGLENEIEDSYELLSVQTRLGVRYWQTLTTTWIAALQFENVDVDEKTEDVDAFDATGGTLLDLILSWIRDTSDDRLDPTTGSVLSVRTEGTLPGRPSNTHFVSVEGAAAGYRELSEGWISASHLVLGWAKPLEDSTDLLPNKRFYAGGSTSMRGFARRRLGPVDADEAPLGGEAKLEASTELRFPIKGKLRGALFVDAGQVWSTRSDFDLGDVEVAVGPALMFQTPLGPVRTDVGFRVTDLDPRAPTWQFHLTIGHPY